MGRGFVVVAVGTLRCISLPCPLQPSYLLNLPTHLGRQVSGQWPIPSTAIPTKRPMHMVPIDDECIPGKCTYTLPYVQVRRDGKRCLGLVGKDRC
ncbi:hypothetical protein GGR50DRAFT_431056 [Xylaria sp. CBS 124048]|nr:hypothetical protein GGR50DRAFT_431056 [Xylaria sp. CBS 124048]